MKYFNLKIIFLKINPKTNSIKQSGLSNWIGEKLKFLALSKKEVILGSIVVIAATATEFTSNISIASIFIPLVDTLVNKNKFLSSILIKFFFSKHRLLS